MYDKQVIASRLRGLRAERRLTQAEVADLIGCSQGTIVNYEDGKRSMSIGYAMLLADLYGVTLDDLVGRKKEE